MAVGPSRQQPKYLCLTYLLTKPSGVSRHFRGSHTPATRPLARARAVTAERAAFTRQNAVRASCQKGLGAVGGVGAAPRVQRPSSPGAFTGKPVAAEAAKKAGAK